MILAFGFWSSITGQFPFCIHWYGSRFCYLWVLKCTTDVEWSNHPSGSRRSGRRIHFGRWSSCSNEGFAPRKSDEIERNQRHQQFLLATQQCEDAPLRSVEHVAGSWLVRIHPHKKWGSTHHALGRNASSVSMANRPEGCAFQRVLSWVRWRIEFLCRCFPQTGIQWISLSPIPENGTPGLWAYRISETAVSGIIITWYFLDGLRHVGTTNQLGSAKAGRYSTYSLTGSYTGGWQFGAEGSQRGSQRKLQPRSRGATIDNDWLWLHHSNSGSWKSYGDFFRKNIWTYCTLYIDINYS